MKKTPSKKAAAKAAPKAAPKSSAGESLGIDLKQLQEAFLVIRSLNHKLRLGILKLLTDKPKTPVNVIYVKLKMEQSVASQHLAILRKSGLVIGERDGHFIYYSVNPERISHITSLTKQLVG